MVGEDTHVTRLGGNVDLDDVLRLEDGLVEVISMRCYKFSHGDGAPRRPGKTGSARAIESRNTDRSFRSVPRKQFEGLVIPGEAETGSA